MDDPNRFTIDELARRAGMTVRNVRAHQARGLLPAPELEGRTGFYGPEHLARLELIKELQADGFNLEAIRRLLESAGGSTSAVLRFTRSARESFDAEEPQVLDVADLVARWGSDADPRLLERSVELGLLRPLGEGRYEDLSPRLTAAAAELLALGMPPGRALSLLGELREHADGVARAYVRLFLEEIWEPFDAAGRPPERWPEIQEALERLRPLAAESLLAVFGIVMQGRVDEAIERQIVLAAGEGPAAG
jgi:DNA-binding transcriptional MerR regulator